MSRSEIGKPADEVCCLGRAVNLGALQTRQGQQFRQAGHPRAGFEFGRADFDCLNAAADKCFQNIGLAEPLARNLAEGHSRVVNLGGRAVARLADHGIARIDQIGVEKF